MSVLDFLFGRSKPTPTTTTQVTTSKLPEEIAPFVKEVLGEAQQLYEQRKGEGYKEFPGETVAPRTAEELAAMEGLRSLVGTQEPYRAEAEQMIRTTPTQFTAEEAQRLMSPYQRAVTDIEKREAQRAFERDVQPALEARAIQAGGMSGLGTRAAVQAAEAQRAQSQLLADIEAKGQQRAFEQAYRQFGDETATQRQRAFDIGDIGTQRFNIGLAERGLQQQLGQEDRAEAQALINEQYAEFLEREQFPESTLAQYSSFVYGNPFLRTPDTTQATTGVLQPTTSMGQQLLGLGLTGLSTFGAGTKGSFNLSDFSLGNIFRRGGGSVAGGLASLPVVKRQAGTRVGVSPLVARTMQRGLPRPTGGLEGQRKLDQAAIARDVARRKAIEQAGRKYITDADRIAQESIANQKAALMKQFEGVDTFSGPTGEAMKALYAPDVETKGLVGALNVALPAFMSERSKMQQERKTKEATIESENIALQRAASLATVEQENKLADKLSNAQEKIDAATTKAEKEDATYELRMATADLNAIKTATDIYNSMLEAETENIKALTDRAKLGKIDRNDAKTVRQIVAGQFGYVFDDEGLKIGGDVLDSTDPRLVEFERVAERLLDKLRDTGKDYNKVQKEARVISEERQAKALIESGNVQTLGSDGKISVTRGRGRNAKTVKQEPKKGTIYKLPSGRFGRYMGNGKFESVE
jgi:hypothetical protein